MQSGTIGERIRSERERLSLSQAEIAERLGITGRTQRNYESGTRVPNAEYLAALAPLGVDINYILNGIAAHEEPSNDHSYATLSLAIGMSFGISQEAMDGILDKSLVNDLDCGFDPAVFFSEMLCASNIFRLMADRYSSLDAVILSSTVEALEDELFASGATLSPHKKADALCMLYRAFKASGNVDPELVRAVVKLAKMD